MACFIVPATGAIVTKAVEKTIQKSDKEQGVSSVGNVFVRRLPWLRNMLAGGSFLLAFEHVWHGEVQPFFPFLTAMSNPGDASEMFAEMGTVGVGMLVLVTAAWAVMVKATDRAKERVSK
ncbi:MAG: hypothetical protein K6G07_04105 [Lachnospiraceae bacterium]|nr:hypothetical protein [Lachnospiraceae bacterium]